MKIWLLEPIENLPDTDNPWGSWHNKVFGFVVCAETEHDARNFAHGGGCDENRTMSIKSSTHLRGKTANTDKPWLDPKYSSCVELGQSGEAGIVMMDFAEVT